MIVGEIIAGGFAELEWTIRNAGNGKVNAATRNDGIWISSSSVFSSSIANLISAFHIIQQWTAMPPCSGRLLLRSAIVYRKAIPFVKADNGTQITESDEDNNVSDAMEINITPTPRS